jgi:hypothetical protein
MFDIAFISSEPEIDDEGRVTLLGEITLGTDSERFLASLSVWTRKDYERQWKEAAQYLVDGGERTAFFTSAFGMWWQMWQDEGDIRVQEQLLHADRLALLPQPLDLTRTPYELIEDYQRITEDGEAISEWRLTVRDIERFLRA